MKPHALWLAVLAGILPSAVACSSAYMRNAAPVTPPGPDEARVIVYRTSLFGAAATFPVYDGEKLVGFTERGGYFEVRCAPGEHLFISWGEGDAAVAAELAPGKTYYIKSYAKMGVFSARAGLQPVLMGSKEWGSIPDEIKGLQCRELIPELAEGIMKEQEEKVRKTRDRYQEGRRTAKPLKPEDGR